MRPREAIENDRQALLLAPDFSERDAVAAGLAYQRLQLEVLLDIRDQLVKQDEDVARCPHGSTGLCMSCVIVNDLMRPRS